MKREDAWTMIGRSLRAATVPALEAIPGLVHGFERRLGPAGWETRDASRRRVAGALASEGRLLFLKQVHGATVQPAPWVGTPEADAAVADAPGWLLGIETADCLPVLLVDPSRRLVAVAHAGWRGTAAGVAGRAVDALIGCGSDPADLLTVLGPAIGPCCYEVGEELEEAFGPFAQAFFHAGPRGRSHFDLRRANAGQLLDAGVPEARIHHLAECTSCNPDLYPSYRRDGAGAGRMVSYVGWRLAGR